MNINEFCCPIIRIEDYQKIRAKLPCFIGLLTEDEKTGLKEILSSRVGFTWTYLCSMFILCKIDHKETIEQFKARIDLEIAIGGTDYLRY